MTNKQIKLDDCKTTATIAKDLGVGIYTVQRAVRALEIEEDGIGGMARLFGPKKIKKIIEQVKKVAIK